MASNRIGRINEEIQKELSSAIRNLKDPRVQNTMISITHVEATPDLRYAKVYISVLDKDKSKETLKGLRSAGGWLAPPGDRQSPAAALYSRTGVRGRRFHRLRRKNVRPAPFSGNPQR